jgi:hypothetical protein
MSRRLRELGKVEVEVEVEAEVKVEVKDQNNRVHE